MISRPDSPLRDTTWWVPINT